MTCTHFGRTYDASHPSCKSCIKQGMGCVPQPQKMEPSPEKKRKGPHKTETAYLNRLKFEFPGAVIRFEGITLTLDNGHRYTPDLFVMDGKTILLVEVKNAAYKHASYGRSRMAFNQARLDYPCFSFRWAEKDGDSWDVEDF